MIQLILAAIVVAIGYCGYRSFLRESGRVTDRNRRAEQEARTRSAGIMVKHPATGECRAKD